MAEVKTLMTPGNITPVKSNTLRLINVSLFLIGISSKLKSILLATY